MPEMFERAPPAAQPVAAMPSPADIAEKIAPWGIAKGALPLPRLLGLGVLAGVCIGFGATFSLLGITNSQLGFGPTRLLGGVAFSFGLMLVVMTGAELSTGNCLLALPWLLRRLSGAAMLRNWVWSFIANAAGALLLVVLMVKSGALESADLQQTMRHIAEAKFALSPESAFYRGILCNALVCLAVWMSFAATSAPGKLLAVIFPIAAFVALGFEHSIANVYLLPLGMLAGAGGGAEALLLNLAAVTLGNLVGGAAVGITLGAVFGKTIGMIAPEGGSGRTAVRWRRAIALGLCLPVMLGGFMMVTRHAARSAMPLALVATSGKCHCDNSAQSGHPRAWPRTTDCSDREHRTTAQVASGTPNTEHRRVEGHARQARDALAGTRTGGANH